MTLRRLIGVFAASIAFILIAVQSVLAKSLTGNRVLVLLDDVDAQTADYSLFFDQLKGTMNPPKDQLRFYLITCKSMQCRPRVPSGIKGGKGKGLEADRLCGACLRPSRPLCAKGRRCV
jgi:hypothetical protein